MPSTGSPARAAGTSSPSPGRTGRSRRSAGSRRRRSRRAGSPRPRRAGRGRRATARPARPRRAGPRAPRPGRRATQERDNAYPHARQPIPASQGPRRCLDAVPSPGRRGRSGASAATSRDALVRGCTTGAPARHGCRSVTSSTQAAHDRRTRGPTPSAAWSRVPCPGRCRVTLPRRPASRRATARLGQLARGARSADPARRRTSTLAGRPPRRWSTDRVTTASGLAGRRAARTLVQASVAASRMS